MKYGFWILLITVFACKGQQAQSPEMMTFYLGLEGLDSSAERTAEEINEGSGLVDPCTGPGLSEIQRDFIELLDRSLDSLTCDLEKKLIVSFMSSDTIKAEDVNFHSRSCDEVNRVAVERILQLNWDPMVCNDREVPVRWVYQWEPAK